MGFFSSIGNAFKSLGHKIGQGASYLGKKTLQGLDYGIQGLKTATDYADKYTFGLDHFIPYYTAFKSGIDIADRFRKIAKGEEKFGWNTVLDTGLDAGFGALSAVGGKAELEGLKGGYKMFKGARATGSGLREALKLGGGRVVRGYGFHPEQLKASARSGVRGIANIGRGLRRADPVAVAKTAGIVGAGVGGSVVYDKAKEDEQSQRQTQRPPQQQQQTDKPFIQKLPQPQPKPSNYIPPFYKGVRTATI